MQHPILTRVAAAALLVVACGRGDAPAPSDSEAGGGGPPTARLQEVWQTERDTLDNIDSPAVWHGPDGQHWLLSTAKSTDVLVVNDAATGKELRRVGGRARRSASWIGPTGSP